MDQALVIGVFQVNDPFIFERLNDRFSVICTAIIDNDKLEVSKSLLQHTLNGFANKFIAVICREDNADCGNIHGGKIIIKSSGIKHDSQGLFGCGFATP